MQRNNNVLRTDATGGQSPRVKHVAKYSATKAEKASPNLRTKIGKGAAQGDRRAVEVTSSTERDIADRIVWISKPEQANGRLTGLIGSKQFSDKCDLALRKVVQGWEIWVRLSRPEGPLMRLRHVTKELRSEASQVPRERRFGGPADYKANRSQFRALISIQRAFTLGKGDKRILVDRHPDFRAGLLDKELQRISDAVKIERSLAPSSGTLRDDVEAHDSEGPDKLRTATATVLTVLKGHKDLQDEFIRTMRQYGQRSSWHDANPLGEGHLDNAAAE